ncbi:dTDP-glucose 4,6-dehydratase [Henriciella aquimarina]|uniref:dTDP-glucose 4,6-dehydratase n=1 Tax=Henriciella aquimarina TaxID=545261 RepID=UPI000A038E26|nr:dTDP-glucose 4,6-dehydratase [Henriciella aquimarina]
MRLLVTGGAGFIGSALIRRALAQGHSVLNIDKLTYAANPDSLAAIAGDERYSFLQADICDGATMAESLRAFRPDRVFNLAAETHVDRSIDDPQAFIRTNINGVHTLLDTCRTWLQEAGDEDGFRFIQISTDEVYGSIASGAFNEASPYQPNSPYSASKASADMLVRAWHRTYGFPAIITNCSNNYGPWQFPEKFIPTIVMKALREEAIPIYGDGQQVRDWLFVDDHADALLRVANSGEAGETYCVGGDATMTNLDLARTVCDLVDDRLGREAGASRQLIEMVADRPGHDQRYAIDHAKITEALGWHPACDLKEGLVRTVDWYLGQGEWLNRLAADGRAGSRLGLMQEERK